MALQSRPQGAKEAANTDPGEFETVKPAGSEAEEAGNSAGHPPADIPHFPVAEPKGEAMDSVFVGAAKAFAALSLDELRDKAAEQYSVTGTSDMARVQLVAAIVRAAGYTINETEEEQVHIVDSLIVTDFVENHSPAAAPPEEIKRRQMAREEAAKDGVLVPGINSPDISPPDNLASTGPGDDSSPPQGECIFFRSLGGKHRAIPHGEEGTPEEKMARVDSLNAEWNEGLTRNAPDGTQPHSPYVIARWNPEGIVARYPPLDTNDAPASKGDPDPPNGPPGVVIDFGDVLGVTISVEQYNRMHDAAHYAKVGRDSAEATCRLLVAERDDLAARLAKVTAIDPSERIVMTDQQYAGYQVAIKACATARQGSTTSGADNVNMAAFLDMLAARAMKK